MSTTTDDAERMPLDLVLVRHGQSEGNVALDAAKRGDRSLTSDVGYRERSAADYRLTAKGRDQAERAGRWVQDWMSRRRMTRFDRLYCSPYVRTRETAAHLGLPGAEWQLEPLLRERDWGLWEGMGRDETRERFEISSEQKARNRFLWRPECGESTPDIDLRVREMLATFARELAGRTVICVTHEDVMWATRFRLEKMTIETWLDAMEADEQDIPNCGILHYTRRTGTGAVEDKFVRTRLIDSARPSAVTWHHIERPRFSNDELRDEVQAIEPLWGGKYS